MGMLTAIQIRSFKEPGRYSDGEGLILNLISPGRGSWMVRVHPIPVAPSLRPVCSDLSSRVSARLANQGAAP